MRQSGNPKALTNQCAIFISIATWRVITLGYCIIIFSPPGPAMTCRNCIITASLFVLFNLATSYLVRLQPLAKFKWQSHAKTAIILVDHGSRVKIANDNLFDVVARYKIFSKCEIIEAAHMELAEPSIKTGFKFFHVKQYICPHFLLLFLLLHFN